ncbi:MAG: hypothetical protein WB780_05405 [Candidatus Acidiferrales bacterium]
MAEEKNKDVVQKVDVPATLSNEQLLRMLLESQKENAKSNKLLADAILESRKPYVDPKVLEAKRQAGEDRKREIQMQLNIKINTKRGCPHIRDNGTPNIKWMEHSNGITKGVCGGCFSEFDTRNKEDYALLRRDLKSIRNMGRAGTHTMTKVMGRVD